MAVTSAERHTPLERLRERLLATLDRLRRGTRSGRGRAPNGHATSPARRTFSGVMLAIEQTDDAVLVRAELPGLGPNDFTVEATRERLTIRGRKQDQFDERGREFERLERRTAEFFSSVQLPAEVDPDRATATFRDGVLRLRLPKTEAARARQVRVPVRFG